MLKNSNIKDLKIDKSWSLFLDRDGVINVRPINDYVKKIEEFKFLPGAPEAISKFSHIFNRIFIVTNQRGIARNLMTEKDLLDIHSHMLGQIKEYGGHIDKIYFCPHNRDEGCACRKPSAGMALKAVADFPEVDLSKSIMVGDTLSDMEFGKNAGMYNILISSEESPYFSAASLKDLAELF